MIEKRENGSYVFGRQVSLSETTAMDVEDLEVYKSAMTTGERIWTIVLDWDKFEKNAIGLQMTRAADSIAANLSEGYGRYHFGENRQFCYYARGSLHELRTWLQKSANRGLISESESKDLKASLNLLGRRLNAYISSIGKISSKSESEARTDKYPVTSDQHDQHDPQ